jgi:hypothetical protein
MPLLIRPVKMNKSIYVRVPNDIAHIIGLSNEVEVSFSFEDHDNQLRLIYSLNKSTTEHLDHAADDTRTTVAARPIQALRTREVGEENGPKENGPKAETQELPEG